MQSFPPSRATSRTRTLTGGTNGSTNGTNGTNGANGSGRNGSPPSRWDTLPIGPEAHPAFHAGGCALITGGASGIGLAAAKEFARLGLRIVIADANEQDLKHAADELTDIVGTQNVCAALVDVSKLDHVEKFRDQVYETFGEVNVLLNNAGVGDYGGALSNPEAWRKVMDVNLFGVLNVVQTFAPSMIHQENPSMIINTGSKQGITNPPGNAAYNVSKAGVRVLTENLAHEFAKAEAKVTAHLFVPGWTYTKMTGAETADGLGEKPKGAWSAEQTVRYMLHKLKDGKFYIICPDNETSEDLDRLRIKWASGDVIEGRPALSRWNPEWKPAYEEYVQSGLAHFEESRQAARGRLIRGESAQEDNL